MQAERDAAAIANQQWLSRNIGWASDQQLCKGCRYPHHAQEDVRLRKENGIDGISAGPLRSSVPVLDLGELTRGCTGMHAAS